MRGLGCLALPQHPPVISLALGCPPLVPSEIPAPYPVLDPRSPSPARPLPTLLRSSSSHMQFLSTDSPPAPRQLEPPSSSHSLAARCPENQASCRNIPLSDHHLCVAQVRSPQEPNHLLCFPPTSGYNLAGYPSRHCQYLSWFLRSFICFLQSI